MRWSDINKLTWAEVQEFDGGTRIVFRQKKTKGLEYLDIAGQAVRYMGQRGKADERVFAGLKYSAWHNLALREWCLKAGITKHITFHCGRTRSPCCNSRSARKSTPCRSSSATAN